MTDEANSDHDRLWEQRHNAIYKAELSALYHQKRERFFELCDKLTKAAAVIGGSATLWKIGDPDVVLRIAGLITVTSAFSLVFSFSERSRRHAELAKTYRQVIAEIVAKGETSFSEQDANQWMAKLCGLEATEPPTLSALVVLCQNELAIARGHKDYVRPLNFFERSLAHFFDMPLKA
jgi:hypothetical protein